MLQDWTYLHLSDPGPLEAKLETLPESPAVYSFCLSLKPPASDAIGLLDWLIQLCDLPTGHPSIARLGPYQEITADYRSGYRRSYLTRDHAVKVLFDDPNFVCYLRKIIGISQSLIPPLYVGETVNLNQRLVQHLKPNSDLRLRLESAGIDIHQTAIRYCLVTAVSEFQGESDGDELEKEFDGSAEFIGQQKLHLHFIEELLTRLCRPGFAAKIGKIIVR